jgi:uncharacterized HAD superfamily protein
LHHPFLYAHRDNPRVAGQRQVMLDVDSTVFPLIPAMNTLRGGERVRYEDIPTYNDLPGLCGGVKPMLALFDEAMTYEKMMEIGVFPGVRESIDALRDHNVKVHVISSRPAGFADGTERYLRDQGVHYDSFLCEFEPDKLAFCQQEGIEVIIDDHPDLLARAAGSDAVTALALRFPYNAAALDQHGFRHTSGLADGSGWVELGSHTLHTVADRVRLQLDRKRETEQRPTTA